MREVILSKDTGSLRPSCLPASDRPPRRPGPRRRLDFCARRRQSCVVTRFRGSASWGPLLPRILRQRRAARVSGGRRNCASKAQKNCACSSRPRLTSVMPKCSRALLRAPRRGDRADAALHRGVLSGRVANASFHFEASLSLDPRTPSRLRPASFGLWTFAFIALCLRKLRSCNDVAALRRQKGSRRGAAGARLRGPGGVGAARRRVAQIAGDPRRADGESAPQAPTSS